MGGTRLRIGDFGSDVAKVQERLQQGGFAISADEVSRRFFGPTTRAAVSKFQAAHGLDPSCEVCDSTAERLGLVRQRSQGEPERARSQGNALPDDAAVEERRRERGSASVPSSTHFVPAPNREAPASTFKLSGTIALEQEIPAANLELRLYQVGFGGAKTLVGTTKTNERGGL